MGLQPFVTLWIRYPVGLLVQLTRKVDGFSGCLTQA